MKHIPHWMKAVLAAVLVVLLLGGWRFQADQERYMRHKVENELMAIAKLKIDQIATWRAEMIGWGVDLMERPLLVDRIDKWMATRGPADREALLAEFRVIQRHADCTDILLTDPDGLVHLSLNGKFEPHQGLTLAIRAAFTQGQPVMTSLHSDPHEPPPHVGLAVPFFRNHGETHQPIGALVLIREAQTFLYPLIQSWPTPSRTAETLLVCRDGDDVLFLNDLRHQPGAALKLRIPLTRTEVPAVMAVLGRTGVFEGVDYRGVEVLSALLPVPESPWFMVSKVDSAEALAESRQTSLFILLLLLSMIALTGAAGLVVWQRNMKAHYRALYRSEAAWRQSEERYAITLKSIGDAVIAADKEGRLVLLNPVAEALTGWTLAEARGRSVDEVFRIINEENRTTVQNPVARVLREGQVVGLANHTLLVARDGSERPIADSGAPIRDDQGAISGVVLVFRDQTEERAGQRALTESEKFLAATQAIAHVGSWRLDIQTKELIWSEEAHRIFDVPVDTPLNLEFFVARVHPDDLEKVSVAWEEALTGVPYDVEHRILVGDQVKWVRELAEVTTDGAGQAIHAHGSVQDITDRKLAEQALRESEEFFRHTFEQAAVGMSILTPEGSWLRVNQRLCDILGYAREELTKTSLRAITPPEYVQTDQERIRQMVTGVRATDTWEKRYIRKNGELIWVRITTALTHAEDGRPKYFITVTEDITPNKLAAEEQEKLVVQLGQAQKMESVGRLAGGVAHDFNNILSIILGNTEMALDLVQPDDPLRDHLLEIRAAAQRSVDLTRQLLAFARKQTVAPKILDLNDTVSGMLKMLRRLIGEDIDLVWDPAPALWPLKIDPAQIDQLLANLAVNARDAIAGVGKVTIETKNAVFDAEYCADHAGYTPGNYVMLAVSDDGHGMAKEVLDHLFEPFFTTKEIGQGTGLGLATVYGVVRQNDGFINVYSEPGKGTTFRIYLPGLAGRTLETRAPEKSTPPMARGETLLLVEDEITLLNLGRTMLNRLGYTVLAAGTPGEALNTVSTHDGEIHLLITDVVMPEMNGRELSDRIRRIKPGLKCLFMSGYTANVIAHRGVLDEGVRFIQKPFSMSDLATKVREAIEQP